MSFHVGQKVVCVNDAVQPRRRLDGTGPGDYWCPNWPRKDHVYTIREMRRDLSGRPRVLLVEVVNPLRDWLDRAGMEADWRPNRFRPVIERKTDISIFQQIARDLTKRKPVKITERA